MADNKPDIADVTCPICLELLIEPVTMPCGHELCMPCFDTHVQETNLNCPLCRMRISSWARQARRENNLIDQDRWANIQRWFPHRVAKRLHARDREASGRASQMSVMSTASSSADFESIYHPSHMFAAPGEIGKEFEEEMKKMQEERLRMQQQQEAASEDLARRIASGEEPPMDDSGDALASGASAAGSKKFADDDDRPSTSAAVRDFEFRVPTAPTRQLPSFSFLAPRAPATSGAGFAPRSAAAAAAFSETPPPLTETALRDNWPFEDDDEETADSHAESVAAGQQYGDSASDDSEETPPTVDGVDEEEAEEVDFDEDAPNTVHEYQPSFSPVSASMSSATSSQAAADSAAPQATTKAKAIRSNSSLASVDRDRHYPTRTDEKDTRSSSVISERADVPTLEALSDFSRQPLPPPRQRVRRAVAVQVAEAPGLSAVREEQEDEAIPSVETVRPNEGALSGFRPILVAPPTPPKRDVSGQVLLPRIIRLKVVHAKQQVAPSSTSEGATRRVQRLAVQAPPRQAQASAANALVNKSKMRLLKRFVKASAGEQANDRTDETVAASVEERVRGLSSSSESDGMPHSPIEVFHSPSLIRRTPPGRLYRMKRQASPPKVAPETGAVRPQAIKAPKPVRKAAVAAIGKAKSKASANKTKGRATARASSETRVKRGRAAAAPVVAKKKPQTKRAAKKDVAAVPTRASRKAAPTASARTKAASSRTRIKTSVSVVPVAPPQRPARAAPGKKPTKEVAPKKPKAATASKEVPSVHISEALPPRRAAASSKAAAAAEASRSRNDSCGSDDRDFAKLLKRNAKPRPPIRQPVLVAPSAESTTRKRKAAPLGDAEQAPKRQRAQTMTVVRSATVTIEQRGRTARAGGDEAGQLMRGPSPAPKPTKAKPSRSKKQEKATAERGGRKAASRTLSAASSKATSRGRKTAVAGDDADLKLALELQRKFDNEVRYRLQTDRSIGSGNEYAFRRAERR